MRGADGTLLGILSVDEPISGRKPSGDEIDVLVAVSEHAALAVQAAQEATRAKANREALERLLAVSASPQRDAPTRASCCSTCAPAISEALGFEKVAVQLLGAAPAPTRDRPQPSASRAGENIGEPLTRRRSSSGSCEPEFDVAGCFLIPARRSTPSSLPDAARRLPLAA